MAQTDVSYVGEIDDQSFQLNVCHMADGEINTVGNELVWTADNVVDGPVAWTVTAASGDIDNVTLTDNGDNTAAMVYDIPAYDALANNGYASVTLSAVDNKGQITTHRYCFKTVEPVITERLACNSDVLTIDTDVSASAVSFGRISPETVFSDSAASIPAVDGGPVRTLVPSAGAGLFRLGAGNGPPTFVEDGLNGYSELLFDSANAESMEAQVPLSPTLGDAFRVFAVVTPDGLNDHTGVILASSTVANQDTVGASTWQIGRNALTDQFTVRIGGNWVSSDVGSHSGTELIAANTTWTDMNNGSTRVILLEYAGGTGAVSLYIDGVLEARGIPPFPLYCEYLKIFENRSGSANLSGRLHEMTVSGDTMTDEEATRMQAYLLCRYALDTSFITDPGPFAVADDLYDELSQFERHTFSDGTMRVWDTINEVYYPVDNVPAPGLGVLGTAALAASIENGIALFFLNLPEYANDAAAGTGGLVVGNPYKTPAGVVHVKL